jgi:hypothetical protein
MNFKSLLVVGLSIATLGLSLPAHADDTANVVETNQGAVVTGDANSTRQNSDTSVSNRAKGRSSDSNTGTSVRTNQNADVLGNYNSTVQDSSTKVENSRRTPLRK